MAHKRRLIIISVFLVGIILGSAVFVYFLLPRSPKPESNSQTAPKDYHAPEVHLYKRRGGVTLAWTYLPPNTTQIDIFRTKKGKEDWVIWKRVEISEDELEIGSIVIKSDEDLADYYFYTAAVTKKADANASTTGNGSSTDETIITILWKSETTTIETPPPDFNDPEPQAPSSTPTNNNTPNTTNTTSTTNSNPATSTAPTSTASTPTPTDPTSIAWYYTPSGKISGSGTMPARPDFWVDHVNDGIEIGWQNLPTGTNALIVYRSENQNGPWKELLNQDDPLSPSSIRIWDNTLYAPHYYRMEANKNGTVLATFGPILLPALQQ